MRSIALAAALVCAGPAAAQEVPIRQAGAGGRYETQLDPKTQVPRFAAAKVAAFRGRVDRLIGMLDAMPETNAPPAPFCHRLKSWIEIVSPNGTLGAEVGVMVPINFNGGRCHRMTGTGVVFRINRPSLLLDAQDAYVRADQGHGDWWLLPNAQVGAGRVIDLGDRIAFTHGRAPLLIPVSAERYLRASIARHPADAEGGAAGELERWIAGGRAKMMADIRAELETMRPHLKPADLKRMEEAKLIVVDSTEKELRRAAGRAPVQSERARLEGLLAALTPAERAGPACVSPAAGGLARDCSAGPVVVELNPRYFDPSRPEAVQLIVMETPAGAVHGEPAERHAVRRALWAAIRRDALAALVE